MSLKNWEDNLTDLLYYLRPVSRLMCEIFPIASKWQGFAMTSQLPNERAGICPFPWLSLITHTHIRRHPCHVFPVCFWRFNICIIRDTLWTASHWPFLIHTNKHCCPDKYSILLFVLFILYNLFFNSQGSIICLVYVQCGFILFHLMFVFTFFFFFV